jgi:hypothetical protein
VIAESDCWVAETPGDAVVGLLALAFDWVDQRYVLPGWQDQGVGGALLGEARRSRPDGLRLWTVSAMSP